jgi:Glycosyltransferase family 9 (heptosyltransferase)
MGLKLAPNRPGETLILFPGALGDAVCLEPTVARLSAEGPVTLCARGGAAEVAALFPSEPRVVSLDRPEIAWLFAPLGSPTSGDDPGLAFLGRFARVRSFTGDTCAEMRERSLRHPDARVAPFPSRGGGTHASHAFLRDALGDPRAFAPWPRLGRVLAEPVSAAARRLVVHPGSGGKRKRSPERALLGVVRAWRDRGGDVEVVLGPAESDESAIWEHAGAAVSRPPDVRSLVASLSLSSCYLGHDAGPSHVAAALGVPTVVAFVTSEPKSFGPRGRAVTWLDLRGGPADADGISERLWRCVGAELP